MTRKIISTVCILLFLLLGYATLTVPSISATGPAILTVGAAVAAWLIWPKKAKQPA
jgi:hypothetical protein